MLVWWVLKLTWMFSIRLSLYPLSFANVHISWFLHMQWREGLRSGTELRDLRRSWYLFKCLMHHGNSVIRGNKKEHGWYGRDQKQQQMEMSKTVALHGLWSLKGKTMIFSKSGTLPKWLDDNGRTRPCYPWESQRTDEKQFPRYLASEWRRREGKLIEAQVSYTYPRGRCFLLLVSLRWKRCFK